MILQHGAGMSALERKELERQLDDAKAELFAEQRRAREKLESIQEVLCEGLFITRMTRMTNQDQNTVYFM